MRTPAPARPGVVENILGRVLDAFQVRSATLLGGAAARALAEAPNLAALMAREPAAPLAGDALAFFCGRPGDPADAWVAAAGGAFGQGGEAAQFEVVAKVAQVHASALAQEAALEQTQGASCWVAAQLRGCSGKQHMRCQSSAARNAHIMHPPLAQERPVRADALLGSSERAVALAALSDSAEYIADVILRAAGRGRASVALAARGADGAAAGGSSRRRAPREMLTEGLKHLMDRCALGAFPQLHALRFPVSCWGGGGVKALRGNASLWPAKGATCDISKTTSEGLSALEGGQWRMRTASPKPWV